MSARPLLCALALSLSAACTSFDPDVGPHVVNQCETEDSDDAHDVSFARDVLPIFQEGCGCHNPQKHGFAVEQTGFSVESYASLRNGGVNSGTDVVIEDDPCMSVIVQKLSDAPPFGSRMPLYGPYLTREQRALIHDWIAEGAREN
jgi:hypothetical protein